jgi:hypothetical protein
MTIAIFHLKFKKKSHYFVTDGWSQKTLVQTISGPWHSEQRTGWDTQIAKQHQSLIESERESESRKAHSLRKKR